MLTNAEEHILEDQLRLLFPQFVATDYPPVLHALLRLTMETVKTIVELDDELIDVADEASCGPPAKITTVPYPGDVLCPHCHRTY